MPRQDYIQPPLAGAVVRLRLLGVTDLHANLYPYDYYRDCPDNSVGLARTASLIAEARKESPNCLLFDNGDILQGTPLGDFAAAAIVSDPKALHPVIAAMNTLDYAGANRLALLLMAFSFVTLSITYSLNRRVWAVWPMHR